MIKQFVKRSQFQFVSLTDANIKSVNVEGDEAYITILNTNGNSASIRRQMGRDYAKALAANGATSIASTYTQEWEQLDFTLNKVPLDVPAIGSGYLQNQFATGTANQAAQVERIRNGNVGIKEVIELKANTTTYPLNILVETVHYVPTDTIAA
ncbi:hypothetical protein [Spirosoma linguale]|uniref:Uncharacterized protein n=1 Tax=Spirosoma linguale (strain ATCC 33905 / DSM 74 / LMG 10896 / Claus 1) TaxID=504472 RepID=D2QGD6_SPILD|nr:hypothetical protein Slin_0680 [Spirosoma linguale DSM 74]